MASASKYHGWHHQYIPFFQKCSYVTNHLLLYDTNYYAFYCLIILLLLSVFLPLFMHIPDIYIYCHLGQNQFRCDGPIFNLGTENFKQTCRVLSVYLKDYDDLSIILNSLVP